MLSKSANRSTKSLVCLQKFIQEPAQGIDLRVKPVCKLGLAQ